MRRFAFRLALALGCPNVDAMLDAMPARMLSEWVAYYGIEPWCEQRADLRMGIICATMANAWSSKGRRMKPMDFMPRFDVEPQKVQVVADQQAMFEAFRQAVEQKRGSDR